MSRRTLVVIFGIALMAGLFFYDRANRMETVIAATVITLEARDDDAGPDTWHVTALGPMGTIALEPLQARPDLAPSDAICVTRITRPGDAIEYRWSPSENC